MSCHPILALTPKETLTVKLIADGFSNREIAEKLGVTVRTTEQHVYNAMKTLNAKNRTHLVSIVLGFIKPDIETVLQYSKTKNCNFKIQAKQIATLRNQGLKYSQIKERVGVGSREIAKALRSVNYPMRANRNIKNNQG